MFWYRLAIFDRKWGIGGVKVAKIWSQFWGQILGSILGSKKVSMLGFKKIGGEGEGSGKKVFKNDFGGR
jgi:F420-0:gamma-glutamyl ligase-like protein